MIGRKRTLSITSGLLFVVVVALAVGNSLLAPIVSADPGGRTATHGYFTNTNYATCSGANCGAVLLNGGDGTDALGGINTKAKLVKLLTDLHNGKGSTDDDLGADFIIQLMRGSPYDHNRVSASDLADWTDRMNNSDITVEVDDNVSYGGWNSARTKGQGKTDEVFFAESGSAKAIVIKDNGKTVFKIKVACGNPLGDLDGLPEAATNTPPNGKITVACGTGAEAGENKVTFTYYDADAKALDADNIGYITDTDGTTSYESTHYHSPNYNQGTTTIYLEPPDISDPNTKLDTLTLHVWDRDPTATDSYKTVDTAQTMKCVAPGACIYPPAFSPASPEPGQAFTVTTSVRYLTPANAAAVVSGGGKMYMNIYGPSPSSTKVFAGAPVTPTASGVTLSSIFTVAAGLSTGKYWVEFGVSGGSNGGTAACGGMTIGSPPTACTNPADTTTCYPPPLAIGSKPYFSVQGGDTVSGANYSDETATPSTCAAAATPSHAIIRSWNTDNNPAGSYVGAGDQDGAFALGQISSFVTGLGNGYSPTGLSFANTTAVDTTAGNYGGDFGAQAPQCAPDYVTEAQHRTHTTPEAATTASLGTGGLTSGTYTYDHSITLSGAVLGAGQRVTIVVTGNVYITSDIAATGAYASLGDIPYFELLVKGGTIYVDNSVSTLYGFYDSQPTVNISGTKTGGVFASCATGGSVAAAAETSDYATCSPKQLTILGALTAGTVHFDRSYGSVKASGSTPAAPAETIQYTPGLWLGADGECTTDSTLCSGSFGTSYDSVTSLPPVL